MHFDAVKDNRSNKKQYRYCLHGFWCSKIEKRGKSGKKIRALECTPWFCHHMNRHKMIISSELVSQHCEVRQQAGPRPRSEGPHYRVPREVGYHRPRWANPCMTMVERTTLTTPSPCLASNNPPPDPRSFGFLGMECVGCS